MKKEISATEAAKLRRDEPETVFLDVREDEELAICRIDGALHIPMGAIPGKIASLPSDKKIIVLCHHGMRSANVQQYLIACGFDNVFNLAGGIHAWAIQVDPEMARY